eukprot:10948.XXX_259303_258616_1 [CDS] Oithona nana genome sequencing.
MSFCSFSRGEVFKDHFEAGTYVCANCEFELFGSESKYGHHTPWPAFHATKHQNSLSKKMQQKNTFKEFMFVLSVIIRYFPHIPNTSIKPRGPPLRNPYETIA